MSIESSILVAGSGLRSITQSLGVTSQNIANAATPGYAREQAPVSSATAGGEGLGVTTGPVARNVDQALEDLVFAQNGEVAGQQATSEALSKIDATQGATAAGNDLSNQVGALVDAFTKLGTDPSNAATQGAVTLAAGTLATGINALANAYQAGRQAAQDALVADVGALNAAVAQVGALSRQIVEGQAQGQGTADLQNQRDVAEGTASQIAGLRFLPQPNGDVVALAGGNQVNLQAASGPFAIANAPLSPTVAGPALTLNGQDVTASIGNGRIGANLALRDTALPAGQAGIDEFAKTLATRLASQGLRLFTDASGAVPPGGGSPAQAGYVGFANIVQVNPAIVAKPALLRDGTNAVAPGTGGAAGFTPNPPGGPAGFTTLVDNVLTYGFGSQAQAGAPQAPPAATGLGASGGIALSYETSDTIAGFAANLVGAQSIAVSAAGDTLATSAALQATLQSRLQAGSGVSLDSELSNLIVLQNAYGANAKVLTAAQALWTDLYNAVTAP